MSSVPEGRAANQPPFDTTLIPPIGALLPGALSMMFSMASPARSSRAILSGESFASIFFCWTVAGASTRSANIAPDSFASDAYNSAGSRPRRAVISAESSAGTMPSLSVVQTLPSRRRKDAPALSSPPKPSEPSNRPSANHLKPTGTSNNVRPSLLATRSSMDVLTTVLPMPALRFHSSRLANR